MRKKDTEWAIVQMTLDGASKNTMDTIYFSASFSVSFFLFYFLVLITKELDQNNLQRVPKTVIYIKFGQDWV